MRFGSGQRRRSAMDVVLRPDSDPETEEAVKVIREYVKAVENETMLSRYFYAHGWFCASKPWEMIIGMMTLTVCTMSMSLVATTSRICGWNYKCADPVEDTRSSDTIILTIIRCFAVLYLYLQFRKMRKLGSKYLLGMAGVFTIASSVIFSVAVINIIGADLTGLHEALPFFLLLVDLSKACTLAKYAFSAANEDDVVNYIAIGMSKLGPQLTLDAIVETLVIGVGTLSGIRTLETMCCFGCLSVIANYLAFMTFYPACLALILEVTRGNRALMQLKLLAKVWQEEEASEKPNPVTQRVKVIMSAGLVFVHLHSRLFVAPMDDTASSLRARESGNTTPDTSTSPDILLGSQVLMPEVTLWWFYLNKISSISVDYILTLVLATLLSVKYVFFDEDVSNTRINLQSKKFNELDNGYEQEPLVNIRSNDGQQHSEQLNSSDNSAIGTLQEDQHDSAAANAPPDELATSNASAVSSRRPSPVPLSMFLVGDSSEDEEESKNINKVSVETQTEDLTSPRGSVDLSSLREVKECLEILKSDVGANGLSDAELLQLVSTKHIPPYKLESVVGDHERGVGIRRQLVAGSLGNKRVLENLPYTNYDYKYVDGACCENVIGYMPVPVGVAGPLLLDGKLYTVPMATTEGCLVASTNRGCRALASGGGVTTTVYRDGMTRAPVVRFATAQRASEVHRWLDDRDNYDLVADAFDSTSRFARLQKLQIIQVSRSLYIRFLAVTGDAMGMNMLSKGSEKALTMLQEKFFPDMEIMSLSGNVCTDKKPSALNWIEGRGKSVVAEAVVPSDVIKNVLKTSVSALVDLNVSKNLIGSAAAGSIGGYNAQAANIVTAIYIATGQDPAQNVCSSHCITLMEPTGPNNEDLYISCTMPSIEVGTVGGGTVLPPQATCLEMLGLRGSHKEKPGTNASDLARVICGAVIAGELSLMSALAAGHLVRSHLKHNRSVQNMAPVDTIKPPSTAPIPRRGSAAASVCSSAESTPRTGTPCPSSAASNAALSAAVSASPARTTVDQSSVNSTASISIQDSSAVSSSADCVQTASPVGLAIAANSDVAADTDAASNVGVVAAINSNIADSIPIIANGIAAVDQNTKTNSNSVRHRLSNSYSKDSTYNSQEPGSCLKFIS